MDISQNGTETKERFAVRQIVKQILPMEDAGSFELVDEYTDKIMAVFEEKS